MSKRFIMHVGVERWAGIGSAEVKEDCVLMYSIAAKVSRVLMH